MQRTADTICVLHVDDEPGFADLAATHVERQDDRFQVRTATSASEGLALLADIDFDCVVSDHDMPETSGIEFLEAVRADYPDLPFILFTGKGSEAVASDAISAGVTDYLQKERGADQYALLANRISNAVESYRNGRQAERTRTQFEAISKHSADAIVTIDTDNRIQFANPAVEDLFGYDPAALEGEPLTTLQPERYHEAHLAAVDEYLATGEQTMNWSNVVLYGRHRDGTEIPLSVSFGEFKQDDETRFIGIMRPFTEQTPADSEGGPLGSPEDALTDYRDIFEKAADGIAIVVPETGRLGRVNRSYADMLGRDPEDLRDTTIESISADDPAFDQEAAMTLIRKAIEGEAQQFDWLLERADGTYVWSEVNLKRTTIGGEVRLLAFVRDITERKAQEERFQAFVEQSNDIISVLDSGGTYKYQSPSVERILGYEPGSLVGENAFEYVHPDDREAVLEAFQTVAEDPSQSLVVEYRFRHADGSWRWMESRGSNQADDSVIAGFVINSRDVTDRKEHEQQVAALHDATREMVQATDEQSVSAVAIETAKTILDHSLAGIWLRDDDGDCLEPAAMTDDAEELFGDHPVYTEGNSLSWRAYTSGDAVVVDDLQDHDGQYNPDSPVRSELLLPLGDYGVMNIASRTPDAFSENDVLLAKLLAANTQVALGRAEHLQRLERQTDQMEFFNSILRHDVLNAVTVIKSRGEFLAADLDGDQLRDAETIVSWADDVQQIVQRVRTVLETLTGEGDQELHRMDLGAELRAELERVQLAYPDVAFDVGIPDDVSVLANDLLSDVLGNVVTNSVDHNDTTGLRVAVTVEPADDDVFVRIADNGSGVDDDRKEAIFRRGETGHAKSVGSGFGLFFVDAMVAKYGGDVWVEDNDAGGATVVIQLPATDQP